MDTQRTNFLKEVYTKEEQIRQQFFVNSGMLDDDINNDAEDNATTSDYEAAKNAATERVALQPAVTENELNMRLQLELSKNMWKRCNPGFNHAAVSTLSTTQEEFLYDEDNIDPVDKTHCRRRDKFTSYVESSARYKLLMKKSRDSGA